MKKDYLAFRDIAQDILVQASPLMLEGFSLAPGADPARIRAMKTEQKTSHKDLVTFYDKRMDDHLKAAFEKAFPGIPVLGEENVAAGKKPLKELTKDLDAFWVFDPIDGTTNFSRAYPFFCTTAAFMEKTAGRWDVKVGVTWDPVRQEGFVASRGMGAFVNRQKLKVTSIEDPETALLTTGFASERSTNSGAGDRAFDLFKRLTRLTLGVRRDGSAALDLAYVANGRIDAYWEWGLSLWDIATGVLLVEESGGVCTHHDASDLDFFSGEILASNGFLHKWLVDRIKE